MHTHTHTKGKNAFAWMGNSVASICSNTFMLPAYGMTFPPTCNMALKVLMLACMRDLSITAFVIFKKHNIVLINDCLCH